MHWGLLPEKLGGIIVNHFGVFDVVKLYVVAQRHALYLRSKLPWSDNPCLFGSKRLMMRCCWVTLLRLVTIIRLGKLIVLFLGTFLVFVLLTSYRL